MMNDYEYNDQYKVPVIAKLLHALPHYNITFHKINSTFRPTDEIYLESLGILGSAPAALLIVSLLGLLLYLMTRCCDRKPRPAHSITSLKVALSIVTVMCCAAIGLGLYGNDDLHNGLLEVLTAGRKVDTIVNMVRNQTHILENTLTNRIRPQLVEFADIFDQPVSNTSALSTLIVALNHVQGNVTLATNAAGDIRRPLMGIAMTGFLSRGDQWELIRWPGTVAILALLLVLCAVLLVGVARHSRCALILFSVCGLLAVTGSWLMSGLYLSTSVAVGDLCINPADFLVSTSPRALPTNVLLHYTQCEPGHTNPFTQRLRESQNAINSARSAMSIVSRISLGLFKSSGLQPKLGAVSADLNSSERLLTQLTALVDCKAVHHNYLTAARGLCEGGLLGLVLMLIASFIAAILLTIMVWVDSHTWIYIRKRTDYAQVDEPSYISHPAPQNHQAINARTLPRNHNGHFSPPAISGSHTLQHPSKRQHQQQQQQLHQQQQQHHDMMSGGHGHHPHPSQQAMRAMGTHTLGRLPSHNHSPNHLPGPNNACSEPVGPNRQLQQQQQQQQQPIYCHHPHQHPHAAHLHQQQHAQYHLQQQQQQQQQQHLYGTNPAAVHHQQHLQQNPNHQIYQQIPAAQLQQQPPIPLTTANHQTSIYQSTSVPITTQSTGGGGGGGLGTGLYSSNSATMRRQPTPSIYHQQQLKGQQLPVQNNDTVEAIPSSNAIDSAMYERDKQIYRCSTLRQGGKFDPKYKPSILNCPLPEIPKDADQLPPKIDNTTNKLNKDQPNVNHYTKTLNRAPMKLPPPGKAIPPPKIETPTSPPPPPLTNNNNNNTNINNNHNNGNQIHGQINNHTKSPPPAQLGTGGSRDSTSTSPPPPPPPPPAQLITTTNIAATSSATTTTTVNNLVAGANNGINPNDDSNYAVTEL